MFTPHLECRACGYGRPATPGTKSAEPEKLIPVFDLGIQPLANDFREPGAERAGYAPLQILFCPRCTLAQLSVSVSPAILYSHYSYVTSPSRTMLDHFESLYRCIVSEHDLGKVLEVGSNDGALLRFLADKGAGAVCGIDPARNLCEVARQSIPSLCGVFGLEIARESLVKAPAGYDTILARHVFCHVDDWREFFAALDAAASREAMVCIEVPYVADLIERGEFDTIYHEHTSYLSLRAMAAALKGSGFKMHRIERFPIHGGAILIMLRREESAVVAHESVALMLEHEHIEAFTWREFECKAKAKIEHLRGLVKNAVAYKKRVCGYGASAKSTVWVNACGFTRKELSFITDTTPQKLYKVSPGSDIPIVDEGALTRELPDYAILFAWNFAEEIVAKEKIFQHKGGKWIVPHPDIRLI